MLKQKGFVLIASIFLVFFVSLFLSIAMMRSNIQLRAIDLRRSWVSAFYAADTGIDAVVNALRQNQDWWQTNSFDNITLYFQEGAGQQKLVGYYSANATLGVPLGNITTVNITSEGRDAENLTRRILWARATVERPVDFFASTVGDLFLESGLVINGTILARDVTFSVDVTKPDPTIRINGDVEYTRAVYNSTDPNVFISGAAKQRDPITFVGLDLSKYSVLAEKGTYIQGDLIYNGEINWANLEALENKPGGSSPDGLVNGIVYVDGDLHIQGHVSQPIHIVATGDIYIEGDLTCDEIGGVEQQIGLSAARNVIIPDTALAGDNKVELDAFILADGGTLKAQGNYKAGSTLDFEGALALRGSNVSGQSAVKTTNVFDKRNFVYDQELRSNMTIPYLSFSVNLIEWKEVK